MAKFAKPAAGTWTQSVPGLGTGPVSFADSVSPEFFAAEGDAIFRRAWLNVGRVDELTRPGSYFTKTIAAARASVLVTRDLDDTVRAFHNVCPHRGNKLVWDESPYDDCAGNARAFSCRYHGWQFAPDGTCEYVHQPDEFFDLDRGACGLVPVHCDTWAGLVFVNLADDPEWSLHEFLGSMVGALAGYPFDRMTERYTFRAENHCNWKLFIDAFQEYYHVPPLHTHQLGPAFRNPRLEFDAAHYQFDGPHRMVSTSGSHKHDGWPVEHLYPSELTFRSGNTGPWDAPDVGPLPSGINPGRVPRWGVDAFQVFPNLELLFYERSWYLLYRWWPTAHDTHVFEGELCFVPARTARERAAREYAAVTFKEYALQDAGMLDGTQLGLAAGAYATHPLNDQEVLVRHFRRTVHEWVAAAGGPDLRGTA